MEAALPWLIIIAVGGTFVVLIVGVIAMLRGGATDGRRSNRLMRLRVIFQLAAIVLVALAFLFGRG